MVGQVVDGATGRPVGGAIVSLRGSAPAPPTIRPNPSSANRVLTGSDGRFVFRDLRAGSFAIVATKPGYAEGAYGRRRPAGPPQQLALSDGDRVGDVVVRMWRCGAISGTVVDEAGDPVVAVEVRAFPRSVVAGIRRFVDGPSIATDDRGMYRIGNLLPGDYVMAVVSRQLAVPVSAAATGAIRSDLMSMSIAMPGASMDVGDAIVALGLGSAIPPPPQGGRLFMYPTTYYPSATSAAQATVVSVGSAEERTAVDFQLRPAATAGSCSRPSIPDSTCCACRSLHGRSGVPASRMASCGRNSH